MRVEEGVPESQRQRQRVLIPSIPSDGPPSVTEYAPLATSTGLFRRFAGTIPDEPGILAFANKYGSLKAATDTGVHVPGNYSVRLQCESLMDWRRAIGEMRAMVAIWDAATSSKIDELSNYAHWSGDRVFYKGHEFGLGGLIASPNSPELLARFTHGDLVGPAMYVLQRAVNQMLDQGVAPQMLPNASGQLVIRLIPNSLIGALWLQFARAAEGNKAYRQCQNCKDWIEVGGNRTARSDKKFCNPSCKSAFHRPKKGPKG